MSPLPPHCRRPPAWGAWIETFSIAPPGPMQRTDGGLDETFDGQDRDQASVARDFASCWIFE